ncbi:hypothetical protein [Leptospira meyeri]|uniref:hypothetical protein n=1 Tax=Leptospira meyeri TaxID=29508 RepID=UPI000C2AE4CD|nr:hypothetical protein [Leptospira meyeri]PJZ79707.1 hypothetical protein CH359_17470 [Leptospira meyeri]PJZ96180.1 hypothetical protein CH358_13240 [Leptospira meyeri]
MKKTAVTILILLFTFQCRIFKPSSLDPAEDIGSLQSLLRLLSLADAFNTYSQTVAFMKFTDSNGNPYNAYKVEYSVFNEADENGVPVSDYGETGNIRTYTLTLDPNGRGFLTFSERGIATLTVKTPGDVIVGSASFRIYNGITKQSFSLLSQSGATQFILEDLANYRNRMTSNATFTPLGSANGRQFIYLQVQTSSSPTNSYSDGYIASSADGENYDQVTKIDGVNIQTTSEEYRLKLSTPVFNGSDYVFFLSEERRTYPGLVFLDNKNLFLRIPSFFPPFSVTAQPISLPTNYRLFSDNMTPAPSWYYPVLYLGSGRYMITPLLSGTPRPLIVQLDSDNNVDLVSGFSCLTTTPDAQLVAYQLISHLGINYLQCPINAYGSTFVSKSIRIPDLVSNQVTFDTASSLTFDSPIFQINDQLIALLFFSGTYYGYTFPINSYSFSNPTITKNATAIPGFTSAITGTSSNLRTVKSSNANHYLMLSNVADFSVSPSIEIYRSMDGLASVSLIQTLPINPYIANIPSNAEQFQSANGKLNYSYSISAGTGAGSFPVYLTYFTNDSGTWESLPRLIKIR